MLILKLQFHFVNTLSLFNFLLLIAQIFLMNSFQSSKFNVQLFRQVCIELDLLFIHKLINHFEFNLTTI